VRDSIICINELQIQNQVIHGKIVNLINSVNDLKKNIVQIQAFQSNVTKTFFYIRLAQTIENAMSYVEAAQSKIRRYQNIFQYRRDLAVIGHLTESLISRKRLRKILRKLGIVVDMNYLYMHATVSVLQLDNDILGFHFTIPILDGESYTAWDLSTVPFIVGGRPHILRPELYHIGVGSKSGQIIEIEYCNYDHPMLCSSPIIYDNLQCVDGILSRNPRKIEGCEVQIVDDHALKVKRLSPKALLIYSSGELITERCKAQPTRTTELPVGTYIISLEMDCHIVSEQGWQFTYYRSHTYVENITDAIILLGNINLTLPEVVSEQWINVTAKIEQLTEFYFSQLPQIKPNQIPFVRHHVSILSYLVTFCFITLVITLVSYYYYTRKRKAHQPNNLSVAVDEAVEETNVCINDND
jgi:hypothetical protein